MKKIVVFGNQQLTIDCLNVLIKRKDVEIVAVVGCETERDYLQGYPSIERFSKKNKLNFLNPQKLNHQVYNELIKHEPDLGLSIMYRNIFNNQFIKMPKLGLINFHPSLLPSYRGPIPWVWAMINGEDKAGITLHYIDEGIDTGDIIDQSIVKIKNQTGNQLLVDLMDEGIKIFKKNLDKILSGKNSKRKQKHTKASYFGPYNPKIDLIDWFQPSKLVLRRINAVTYPYNGAIAYYNGKEIKIWKAKLFNKSKINLNGPGRIVKVTKNGLVVSTSDGYILITHFESTKEKVEFARKTQFDLI